MWEERVRKLSRGRIPYGYRVDDNDPHLLVPIPEEVKAVEEGMDLLDQGLPLREVTDFIVASTGRELSHSGLRKIWLERRGNTPTTKAIFEKNRAVRAKPKMTKEQKLLVKAKKSAAAEKRRITHAKKRLEALQDKIDDIVDPTPVREYTVLEEPEIEEDQEVVFKPNPGPQTDFLAASEREVLYGGAAGGGKSYALLADPLRYFSNPNFVGIILRRTNDELRELIWKGRELYNKAFPGTKWREQQKEFLFPSGARLWMTYLERDDDVLRYQGQAFNYIAFDELTQHPTSFAWEYMRSRLRTQDKELPLFMRATTNPGGPGHGWVKRMFIDPAPANTPFTPVNVETGEKLVYPKGHAKEGEPLFQARFIPASLYDNPYLAEDGQYEAGLLSMSPHQRQRLLYGDWTVNSGAAFPEFTLKTHVVKPFDIPFDWQRFRAADYGYSSYSAVLWFAVDPSTGQLIVYDELYVSKATGRDLGRMILEREERQKIQYGVLDSSCWHDRGQTGPTIAEEMIREGCRWRKADRSPSSRVSGRLRLHELLKTFPNPAGEDEIPGIVFFDTCRQIITDLPMIPTDPKGGDDIDERYASDHTYDALRYGIMSRPRVQSIFDSFGTSNTRDYIADNVFGY